MRIQIQLIVMIVMLLSFRTSALSQESLQEGRLEIAKEWLAIIGVDYKMSITSKNAPELRAVLGKWRIGASEIPKSQAVDPEFGNEHIPERLSPSLAERFARISTFSAEEIRTPNSVLINGGTTFVGNPDHGLLSLGGSLNLGELYINPEIRNSLCDTARLLWNKAETDKLKCDDYKYLVGGRIQDTWGRIGAAITVKTTVSQVPSTLNGFIVSDILKAKNIKFTYKVTGSLDPTMLFRSPSDWKSWSAHYRKGFRDELPAECTEYIQKDTFNTRCFERLEKTGSAKKILITFVPRIDVTAYSPFDLVKYGAVPTFVEPPGGGKTIYDVALTWDLKRFFPSAQNRSDALKAYQVLHSSVKKETALSNEEKAQSKLDEAQVLWRKRVEGLYLELATTPGVGLDSAWWSNFRATVLPEK